MQVCISHKHTITRDHRVVLMHPGKCCMVNATLREIYLYLCPEKSHVIVLTLLMMQRRAFASTLVEEVDGSINLFYVNF